MKAGSKATAAQSERAHKWLGSVASACARDVRASLISTCERPGSRLKNGMPTIYKRRQRLLRCVCCLGVSIPSSERGRDCARNGIKKKRVQFGVQILSSTSLEQSSLRPGGSKRVLGFEAAPAHTLPAKRSWRGPVLIPAGDQPMDHRDEPVEHVRVLSARMTRDFQFVSLDAEESICTVRPAPDWEQVFFLLQ